MTRLIFSAIALLLALSPIAMATATRQFGLNPVVEASSCWVVCHSFASSSVPLPDVPINSYTYIDRNCRNPPYISAMSTCLAQRCESAPDAAYAAEYGTSICKRAGVDVALELPEEYVAQAHEYFTSPGYTSSAPREVRGWGLEHVGVVALIGLVHVVAA